MLKNIQNALIAIFFAMMIFFPIINFADSKTSCNELDGGYYLGISVGYDVFSIKNELYNSPFYNDPIMSVNGVMGGVFVGYRKFFEQFYNTYIGTEFFINGSSADSDYQLSSDTHSITTDVNVISSYGFSMMPSIRINPQSMIFARIGYNWAKIEVNQINIDLEDDSLDFNDFDTLHGMKYGLGLETVFFKRLNIRFEYQYTQYNEMKTHTAATISPKDQQWVAGLIYRIT